eukprot:546784-Rhodomonas_salina.1
MVSRCQIIFAVRRTNLVPGYPGTFLEFALGTACLDPNNCTRVMGVMVFACVRACKFESTRGMHARVPGTRVPGQTVYPGTRLAARGTRVSRV